MIELIPLILFLAICLLLMLGFPVAFTLAGTALVFAAFGIIGGVFDPNLLKAMPDRIFGTMNNETLIAIPLFVLMGILLEKSRLAEELLENMSKAFGRFPGVEYLGYSGWHAFGRVHRHCWGNGGCNGPDVLADHA